MSNQDKEENEHTKRAKDMLQRAIELQEKQKKEQEEWDRKVEKIKENELQCDHLGSPVFGAQQAFKDEVKGIFVIISTIMCGKCGHLFFDQQDTGIKVEGVFPIKKESLNGKN